MKNINYLVIAFMLSVVSAVTCWAVTTDTNYPVGCFLRKVPSLLVTGATSTNRYIGYMEAIEVVYHSDLPDEIKDQVIEVLAGAPRLGLYVANPQ